LAADLDLKKLERIVAKHGLSAAQVHGLIDRIQAQSVAENRVKHHWGTGRIRIGLCGDDHIGSLYSDQAAIDDVYKRFKAAGVEAVYKTGDITEGYGRRKGHSLECSLHGADAQVKGAAERIPDIGKPQYFITGDHDGWHWEAAGVDAGKALAKERKDLHYLGAFNATVELSPKTTLGLVHPATGTAYAISYKPQKIVEALSGGEKPSILGIGHFHKAEYLFYRNVHVFQTGCLQSQTPWMRRMNLSAHKGAWILDVHTKRSGEVDQLGMVFLPHYE
jgi:predicted phosphodiesterase